MSERLGLRLTADDLRECGADHLVRLLQAEEHYGGQAAALVEEPELAALAPELQRLRARQAALRIGVQLRGDGRPFPPEVIAETSRVFRALLVSPREPDALA